MPVREVSDQERMALVRRNLKNAAEIVEAFKAAHEDSLTIDRDEALDMLSELRNCIESAYVDAQESGEQTFEFRLASFDSE